MANLSPPEKAFVEAAPTWDLNKDGVVTCDEWKQYAGDVFRQADVNSDGALTKDEFQTIVAQDRLFEIADFSYFDADGDGRVTLTEFVRRAAAQVRTITVVGGTAAAPRVTCRT